MTALAVIERILLPSELSPPVDTSLVVELLGKYKTEREELEKVGAAIAAPTIRSAVDKFLILNRGEVSIGFSTLFNVENAIKGLNADYWQTALNATGVLDVMAQDVRSKWQEQITERQTPDFLAESVIPTVQDLLLSRDRYFAERVDGLFKSLSGTHITNSPIGFGKRMILEGVIDKLGLTKSSKIGYINDLRFAIARFMGRDYGKIYLNTGLVVADAQKSMPGQWLLMDGGAIRLRVYQRGTVHIEIHPDMAWRLNAVLATLYPSAIAAPHRTRPKVIKDHPLIQIPLGPGVCRHLSELKFGYHTEGSTDWRPVRIKIPNSVCVSGKPKEVINILESIGGVVERGNCLFDYDPLPVIRYIAASGLLPDDKSHQFFPSSEFLAEYAVSYADIQPGDDCCEPSAGTGGIAKFMPKDQTVCLEVSEVRRRVLKAQGFNVIEENGSDFLRFDRVDWFNKIVMNPPFSEGRWKSHVLHAASMLRNNGTLVAILPTSAKSSLELPGFACAWHGPFDDQFEATKISVVILVANKL
jgi:hypothetical protein